MSLNIPLDNARASLACSGRELVPNLVEVLQRTVTSSEDPVRKLQKLKKIMNSQGELLKQTEGLEELKKRLQEMKEEREAFEERVRKLFVQEHGRRRHPQPSDRDSTLGGNEDIDVGADDK